MKERVKAEQCYATLIEKSNNLSLEIQYCLDTGHFHERGLSIVKSLNIDPSSIQPK